MAIDQIRRNALSLWLQGLRLPITAAERIAQPSDPAAWPPAVAFRRVEAGVNGFVGSVTRDQILIGLANLQRAEVEQRETAAAKAAEAEETRAEARRTAEAKEAELERQREQAERRADEREERAEREAKEAEAEVAQRAAEKKAAARKQSTARKSALETQAAKSETVRLRKEAEALQKKEQAVRAEGTVLELDDAVRAKKAARRAG